MGAAEKKDGAQEWFLLDEAAAYVRMSPATLQKHIDRGHIQPDSPARPGFRRHRFRRATLDAFLIGENDNGRQE